MDGKELFLMIEAISNEKNITKEDVIESLEEALAVATKKRNNIDVRVEVDRHSGEFKTFRRWLVLKMVVILLMTMELNSTLNYISIKLSLMAYWQTLMLKRKWNQSSLAELLLKSLSKSLFKKFVKQKELLLLIIFPGVSVRL